MVHKVIAVGDRKDFRVLMLDTHECVCLPLNAPAPALGEQVEITVRDTPGCGPLRWVKVGDHEAVPEHRIGSAYTDTGPPRVVERARPTLTPKRTVRAVTRPTDTTWIAFLDDDVAFASTGEPPHPGTVVWTEGTGMRWAISDGWRVSNHDQSILDDFEAKRRAAHPLDPDRDVSPRGPVADRIAATCDRIKAMLLEKNRRYGNSALDPLRAFSRADPVEQLKVRIDDKLSRIARGATDDDEDTVLDLVGYLVLLLVARADCVRPPAP